VHLRYGRVESRHLKMLRTLLLKRPIPSESPRSTSNSHTQPPSGSLPVVDFVTQPWADAALITPRHAVRTQWNEAASQKRCSDIGQRLFICPALDRIKSAPLTLEERYALASRHKNTRKRRGKDLPESILLAIGMKFMVTNNLQTDLEHHEWGPRHHHRHHSQPQRTPPRGRIYGSLEVSARVCFGEARPHTCRDPPTPGRGSNPYPTCLFPYAD